MLPPAGHLSIRTHYAYNFFLVYLSDQKRVIREESLSER